MAIRDEFRKLIVKEINYVINKINKEGSIESKLYYFTGVHGIMQRLFNIDFDEELLIAHFVLNATYSTLNQRLISIKNREAAVPLEEEQLRKLTIYLRGRGVYPNTCSLIFQVDFPFLKASS